MGYIIIGIIAYVVFLSIIIYSTRNRDIHVTDAEYEEFISWYNNHKK